MKLCITAQGDNLEARIDPRFGRSEYFIFVDSETLEFEAIKNPNADAMGGAGIQSGQLVLEKQPDVLITGNNVGPNAFQILKTTNISIITGVSGTVKEAIEKYKKGELKPGDYQS